MNGTIFAPMPMRQACWQNRRQIRRAGSVAEFRQQFALGVQRIALQVGPDVKPRDPVRDDLARIVAKRHAQDDGIAGAGDGLQSLIAHAALGLWDQPRQHHHPWFQIDALFR